ncbi:MAG: allantoate amidohydrolase [Jatrophihabitans sp.]|uniref:allantoate amidohydrolase n=1 Tax=Jatrophihabitans sp. TaxID=1932789 RepID=UPI0039150639
MSETGFDSLWSALEPIGRHPGTGGYRRFAWTAEDATLREWFAGEAAARGLSLTLDRAGNQWAWQGDPDDTAGIAVGSHLDSVPEGGAFDGPLGVVSAFAALDALRADGFAPARPIGVVNIGDEEGARFGVACAGSRIMTGALDADRARSLTDADGTALGTAMGAAGHDSAALGRDDETLRRIAGFVELHVEQGRNLVDQQHAIGVASAIRPHGRWRIDLAGEANHAGTTGLTDRRDAMVAAAAVVLAARAAAERHGAVATCGKLRVEPNGVNAIASHATVWLDARAATAEQVRAVVADVAEVASANGGRLSEESWSDATTFPDPGRLARLLDDAPILDTGAGHDAGILAAGGIPAAMLFVRNPTGISHSPAEYAERDDCLAGVAALATVIRELAG